MIKNALDFAGILSFFEERGPVFTIIYQLFIENVKGPRQLFFFQFELGMLVIQRFSDKNNDYSHFLT